MQREQVDDREMQAQAAKIESMLDEIESLPDPTVRAKVADIVESLLTFYGEGLARMLGTIARVGSAAEALALQEAFTGDPVVSHLLMLHDLHPVDIETRVAGALESVRPYLKSHGGNVELVGVEEGVAYLRLHGHCNGCPSSTMTLKLAIEEAIRKAAPDLMGIEAEGVTPPSPAASAFVPMAELGIREKR